ncbi:unnamed protein product [Rodentolepis nana]|uniref:PDZ domain-containing protein n=1 Tax=Rodentolepis nana TaxID=102285 RepID=A0A0R3TVK1_RODNA|nr:unnamed protein product [Rodentolepis nana]
MDANCKLTSGFAVDGAIIPGGPAARSRRIQVGDKITEINGHSLAKISHSDIVEQLCTQHRRLELTMERQEPSNTFRIPVLENNTRTPAFLRSSSRSSERKKLQQTSLLETVPESIDSSWNSRSEAESYNVELLSDSRGFGFSVRMNPELQKGSMVILRIEKGSPAYNDRKMQVGYQVLVTESAYPDLNDTATWPRPRSFSPSGNSCQCIFSAAAAAVVVVTSNGGLDFQEVGDKVLEINGVPTETLTYTQAVKIVKFGGDHLHLKLRRVNTRAYDLSI